MEHEKPEDMEWDVTYPRPMEDLEIQVMQLLRANEPALVKAEREVLECLETSEAVFKVIRAQIADKHRPVKNASKKGQTRLRSHTLFISV